MTRSPDDSLCPAIDGRDRDRVPHAYSSGAGHVQGAPLPLHLVARAIGSGRLAGPGAGSAPAPPDAMIENFEPFLSISDDQRHAKLVRVLVVEVKPGVNQEIFERGRAILSKHCHIWCIR